MGPVLKLQLKTKKLKTIAMMRRLVMSMGPIFVNSLTRHQHFLTADFGVPKSKTPVLFITKTFLLL